MRPAPILRVDASPRWDEADEASSEDVALACVEWLLAETNAFYRQHRLAAAAVCSVAATLRDNVLDAVLAATLASELRVDPERFSAEAQPTPELRDRHAAKSVPLKSPPDPVVVSPSSPARAAAVVAVVAAMASSATPSAPSPLRRIPKAMAEQTPARVRRRKRVENDDVAKDARAPVLPQLVGQSDAHVMAEDTTHEARQWRLSCLKELDASMKKPGFTKWATVARAFTLAGDEPSSTEPEMTLGPPQGQLSPALGALKLKTNVDSFSSIRDVLRSPEWRRQTACSDCGVFDAMEPPSTIVTSTKAFDPVNGSKPRRATASTAKNQRGSVVLNDTLSRHKRPATTQTSSSSIVSPNVSSAVYGTTGVWRYERRDSSVSTAGLLSSSASVTPINELTFDLPTLANSPSALASGVALARGDAVLEGPERVDSPSNMSKKRFDLHQRLAMDYLLNGSDVSASAELLLSSPEPSPSLTPTPGGDRQLVKNYVEEPAVPIQLPPSPDPLRPDALVIPRTHLATSKSVPSLRVRTPTSMQSSVAKGGLVSGRAEVASIQRRQRPSTAMTGSVIASVLARRGNGSSSTTALVSGRSAYMREFPKPPKGVVTRAANTSTGLTEEALRVAWSS